MSSDPLLSLANLRRPLKHHPGDFFGPPQYTNWIEESMSWKESCCLGDWSCLPTKRFTGPDVLKLFADCSVNTMNNFKIEQSKHIIHTNKAGKIIEDGILTRTGEQEFIAYALAWADRVRRDGDYDVQMEDLELTKYQLQGPNSLFVLEKLLGREFRDIKFMRNETVEIAGVETVVLRQGMSGEIGFELQAPLNEGRKVWDAVLEAGQEYDIHEMGGRVFMINHLEANYPTNSHDYLPAMFDDDFRSFLKEKAGQEAAVDYATDAFMDYYYAVAGSFEADDISAWYRSPVELGWANRINFDHEFLGDEALKAELADPKRMICTLRWNSDDVVDVYASLFREGDLPDFMEMPQDPRGYMYADKILDKDGKLVGTTSQRGYSAYFREMISLAVVDLEFVEPGNELTVIWGNPGTPQREIRAITAPVPYKPNRGRVDFKTLPAR